MSTSLRGQFVSKLWRRMLTGAAGCAFIGITSLFGTPSAEADPVTYQIFNHPDGSQIQHSTNSDGYILRLDIDHKNQVNTFNANNTTGVYFSWDNDVNRNYATMHGFVTHNESGSTSGYDANDDVYRIEALFRFPQFTDVNGANPKWWGNNDGDDVYNDMIADLLADANNPQRSVERDKSSTSDVARIFWSRVDVELTLVTDNPGGQQYTGPTRWDEFGPDMFFQYDWRLWDDSFDAVAAAGWLEKAYDRGPKGVNDFLFIFGDPVPEPASLGLLALGSVMLIRRRRRTA